MDLQGGGHLVYQANLTDPDTGESLEVSADQMESLKRTIERRVNGAGLGEPIIQILGADRLLVQLPGVSELERAKAYIGETARLEFKRRELLVPRDVTEISADHIVGVTIDYFPEPEPEPAAEGATSTDATPEPAPAETESSRQVFALVEFTEDGAAEFQAIYQRLFVTFVTFQNAQVTGGNAPPPSFLDVTLEGQDQAATVGRVRLFDSAGGYEYHLRDRDSRQLADRRAGGTRRSAGACWRESVYPVHGDPGGR